MVHHDPMESPPSVPASGRFTATAAGAAAVVALAGSAVAPAYDRAGTAVFADTLAFAFAVAAVAVVGAVITPAVPGNRVGWLLLTAAAAMGVGLALTEAGVHGVVTVRASVPGSAYMAARGPGLEAAGMLIAVVGVPVVFPDGRLPGPRWRWLAWCTAAAVACLFLGNVLSPTTNEARLSGWQSPLGLPSRYGHIADVLSAVGVLLAVAAAGGAVAGLITRWRRGGPLVRQQLKFLALAACPPVVVFVGVILSNGAEVPGWIFGVVILPLPVAIAVAVLSRGLYDLRRAAHRTLLWLAMSGAVIGIYAVVVVAAVTLVPDDHSWWPSARPAGRRPRPPDHRDPEPRCHHPGALAGDVRLFHRAAPGRQPLPQQRLRPAPPLTDAAAPGRQRPEAGHPAPDGSKARPAATPSRPKTARRLTAHLTRLPGCSPAGCDCNRLPSPDRAPPAAGRIAPRGHPCQRSSTTCTDRTAKRSGIGHPGASWLAGPKRADGQAPPVAAAAPGGGGVGPGRNGRADRELLAAPADQARGVHAGPGGP